MAESGLWADLERAIALAGGGGAGAVAGKGAGRIRGKVSPAEARVLAKAHAQRGGLVLKCAAAVAAPISDSVSSAMRAQADGLAGCPTTPDEPGEREGEDPLISDIWLPPSLRGLSTKALEDFARGEFEEAARYGEGAVGEVARRLNPYAKLCGGVVREAMRGEMLAGGGGGGGGGRGG